MDLCSNFSVPSHFSPACWTNSSTGRDCLANPECFLRYFPLEIVRVVKEVENGRQVCGDMISLSEAKKAGL
jgi:hypothetical protein